MKNYLEIDLKDLKAVRYNKPGVSDDDALDWMFREIISYNTGFFLARIHLIEARKTKYKRQFNYFKFEYDGKIYTLENDKLKEDND